MTPHRKLQLTIIWALCVAYAIKGAFVLLSYVPRLI